MHPAFLVDSGGEEQTAERVTCVRVAVAVTKGRRVAFCSGGARQKRIVSSIEWPPEPRRQRLADWRCMSGLELLGADSG
jgi:hypothetical protein